MRKLFTLVFLIALLFLGAWSQAFGQTILTNTTLSAAVSSSSVRAVVVASATGISAPSASDYTKATYLYVDRELMEVRAVNGTSIAVTRGAGGTMAAAHASSAFVFAIPSYLSGAFKQIPQGSCTRANEIALPRIEAVSGVISDCNGGQWIQGDATQTQRHKPGLGLRFPDPGGVAYASLQTAGTALNAATEQECTEINLPYSMVIKGLGILNGTAHTDKRLVILYDAGGKVLANSDTAGATSATDSVYQNHDFLKPYYAVGPARYFACYQGNGTTTTQRHAVTGTNDNVIGGAITTQVFGTIANVTVPTTFNSAKAPYFLVY